MADSKGILSNMRIAEIDRGLVDTPAKLAAGLGVRSANLFCVAVVQQVGIPLATLDDDQRKRALQVVQIEEFQIGRLSDALIQLLHSYCKYVGVNRNR